MKKFKNSNNSQKKVKFNANLRIIAEDKIAFMTILAKCLIKKKLYIFKNHLFFNLIGKVYQISNVSVWK